MHIVLVRHGETEMNVLNKERPILNGQAETPLTPLGLQQAIDAGKGIDAMKDVHLKSAVSSTIQRSVLTARTALDQLSYAVPLDFSDGLRERSLGIFEGKFTDEVYAEFPQYKDHPDFMHFREHFVQRAPKGENLTEVTARAWKVLQEAEAECEGDLAIFSHSTTLRALLGKALRFSERQTINLSVPNGKPILLRKNGNDYELISGIDMPNT
jgi:2,3-bisphosphoglycerate-dependent phosphoglycerate mutase